MRILSTVLLVALLTASIPASAQPTPEDWPTADPADVESVDAIMAAVYDVISGPAGPRDWDRFRSLFRPRAHLIPISQDGQFPLYMTVDDYIERATAGFSRQAFFEKEIHRVTERYGPIVHLFSTYESYRSDAPDAEPFARGINSFQLMHDGSRWWVVNIYWLQESEMHPIPAEYLPTG